MDLGPNTTNGGMWLLGSDLPIRTGMGDVMVTNEMIKYLELAVDRIADHLNIKLPKKPACVCGHHGEIGRRESTRSEFNYTWHCPAHGAVAFFTIEDGGIVQWGE